MGDSESDTDGKQHHNPDRGSVLQQHRSNGKSCKVLYQYFEDCSPYERLPLTDKIEELALDEDGFTGLLTLRSCDIHPASWYSVAWYPIYQLPSGMPIRDLHACFLTFHSLTLGQEHGVQLPQDVLAFRPCPPPVSSDAEGMLEQRYKEAEQDLGGADLALLHPFAFAPYRMQGRLWQEAEKDSIVSHSMLAAAGMWVQRRQVAHYDLEFFMRNAPWNMRR